MRIVIEAWGEEGQGRIFLDPADYSYASLAAKYDALRQEGYTSFTAHRIDLVCDFCSNPSVCYRYEIEPGGIMGFVFVEGCQTTHSDRDGKWAACMECATLISQRDWKGLNDRSTDAMVSKAPGMPREAASAMVKGPHNCFQRGYHGQKPFKVVSDAELMGES